MLDDSFLLLFGFGLSDGFDQLAEVPGEGEGGILLREKVIHQYVYI